MFTTSTIQFLKKSLLPLVDEDPEVLKWLRPSIKQFNIYWDHHSKLYEPDFVVETNDHCYLIEIKAKNEILAKEVLEKAKAAQEYCRRASNFAKTRGKKPWSYLIIPHDEISASRGMSYFKSFLFKG